MGTAVPDAIVTPDSLLQVVIQTFMRLDGHLSALQVTVVEGKSRWLGTSSAPSEPLSPSRIGHLNHCGSFMYLWTDEQDSSCLNWNLEIFRRYRKM